MIEDYESLQMQLKNVQAKLEELKSNPPKPFPKLTKELPNVVFGRESQSTSYVTREEYDKLSAHSNKTDAKLAKLNQSRAWDYAEQERSLLVLAITHQLQSEKWFKEFDHENSEAFQRLSLMRHKFAHGQATKKFNTPWKVVYHLRHCNVTGLDKPSMRVFIEESWKHNYIDGISTYRFLMVKFADEK